MMSIVVGLLSVVLGGYGIYLWWGDLVLVMRGILPLSFICGGLLAILAGISSLKK